MRIALDPQMLRTTPLLELPDVVAGMGYEWIELSPREDFIPFFKHPRVDTATVRAFRSKLSDAGDAGQADPGDHDDDGHRGEYAQAGHERPRRGAHLERPGRGCDPARPGRP